MNNANSRYSIDREQLTSNHASRVIEEVSRKSAAAVESSVLSQLNEFISRGLIVVEIDRPVIVHCPASDSVEVRQSVLLKLKDQEYIEKLEKENSDMKARLEAIQGAIK